MDSGYSSAHLANPAAIKQYEGLKHSDDQLDAFFLAQLLILGILPQGYIYPKKNRPVRDLDRKRMFLAQHKTAHILSLQSLIQRCCAMKVSASDMIHLTVKDLEAWLEEEYLVLSAQANLDIYKRGNVYWIKYYRNGKPYRESTKSEKKAEAKRLLKKREDEISEGKLLGIYFERVKFDELAEDFLRDYRINQKKSLDRAERSINHLKGQFEGIRVPDITSPKIGQYVENRLDEGASNATINRELSALKRMLNIGARQTPPKVDRVPHISMLKENNVRQSFFEHGDFMALRNALPSYLKGFVTFGYKTGWRFSEVAKITWSQVDLDNGIVRLEAGETKNDEARTVYLDDELKQVFVDQWEARKMTKKLLPYFPQ